VKDFELSQAYVNEALAYIAKKKLAKLKKNKNKKAKKKK